MKKLIMFSVTLWVLLVLAASCNTSKPGVKAFELQPGNTVIVHLDVAENVDGTLGLLATGIDMKSMACDDDDEEEEGEDDDDGDDDDVECEDGVTPDGLPCADDDDGDDDDDEEECEEEEEEGESFEMLAGALPGPAGADGSLRFLGIDIELPAGAGELVSGSYRFTGAYDAGPGVFSAADVSATQSGSFRVMTTIQSIKELPDGMLALRLFDADVIVDPGLAVRELNSLSGEIEADLDGDDVECEQEGEHEGENEGCK